MGVETWGFINSLNSSWPDGATEPKSQGDDHIKGIKLTLKTQFPNLSAAVNATAANLNTLVGVNATLTGTKLNYSDITTLGTLQNSKVATVDASGVMNCNSKSMTNVNIDSGDIADAVAFKKTVFSGHNTEGGVAGTTYYLGLGWVNGVASAPTSEAKAEFICPVAGTVKGLFVQLGVNGLSASATFSVRKNGASPGGTPSVTVAAGNTAVNSDTTSTLTVAAGDVLAIRQINAAGTGAAGDLKWSLVIQ